MSYGLWMAVLVGGVFAWVLLMCILGEHFGIEE